MPVTQKNREIEIVTPLGADVLLLRDMTITEELGRLFTIDLELVSTENIKFEDLLGKKITIRLNLLNDKKRYFNGYVSSISQSAYEGRYARYHARVHPWLWFLTRTADCRIFQKKTVPVIIKEIFQELGYTDLKDNLSGSYREWDYCVQYRETDFNFVSRLMEQEGIYYFFLHEDGKHTLHLADGIGSHELISGYEKIPYYPPDDVVLREDECINGWHLTKQIQPGSYALNEYDFIRPKADLKANADIAREHSEAKYEIYDYPGEYVELGDGNNYAKTRIQELHSQYEQAQGRGIVRGLVCGGLFSLTEYPREDQNREYLVTSLTHSIHSDSYEAAGSAESTAYSNSFAVIESKTPFRPGRITPKPFVQGPQTAVVVGPSGEEIYTDEHGRVKLQFHWDRYGKKDENSSCWVRVSQLWAGKTWGGIHIPRMGQEVIVEFLEGDPDRPIVTGRVYNGDQTPPYALPANKTQSGIKSRSSKGGGGANFNELRFEDKKGSEEVYIHAEKDQNNIVENDETTSVGHDRTEEVKHDETIKIGNNRTEEVGNDEKIKIGNNQDLVVIVNRKIDVGNDHTEAIHGSMNISVDRAKSEVVLLNSAETVGIAKELSTGGLYQVTVGAAYNTTVVGAKTEEVGAYKGEVVAGAKTVAIGGNHSKTIGGKESVTVTKDRSDTVNGKFDETVKKDYTLKAKKITIQAEDEIVIQVGKAKIAMKKNGEILVEGKDLSLKASGKINQNASGDIIMKGSKIKEN